MSEQPPADRPPAEPPAARTIAMLGNPNVGKTTLFNRLSGLRQKTSNFPGTTQEAHVGAFASARGSRDRLIDLPGTYSLSSTASEAEVCRSVLEGRLAPMGEAPSKPDVLLLVLDATNLRRDDGAVLGRLRARGLPDGLDRPRVRVVGRGGRGRAPGRGDPLAPRRRRDRRGRRDGDLPAPDLPDVLPDHAARALGLPAPRGACSSTVCSARSGCPGRRSCRCSRRTRARSRGSSRAAASPTGASGSRRSSSRRSCRARRGSRCTSC
jgi:hypothetical protein